MSDTDRIVAYKDPERPQVLLCRKHGEAWLNIAPSASLYPVTSKDLENGGFCTWDDCHTDVLI